MAAKELFCSGRPNVGEWVNVDTDMPYADGNYRSIDLADMAHAIIEDRPHRANSDLALHVLEVMEAFETSSRSGKMIGITTPALRPAPLSQSLIDGRSDIPDLCPMLTLGACSRLGLKG